MKRLILEVSLKPFRDSSPSTTETVIREILRQWQLVIQDAGRLSFLLWTAEGSEILEYRGRMEDSIEWAKWIGIANEAPAHSWDPDRQTIHSRRFPYSENAPALTYARLKSIVTALKTLGEEITGKPVTVGTIFDPGPEFAESAFKYQKHPELNKGNIMGARQWIHCAATLHADDRAYAGFPDGIPEGTSLGTYLGRQSQHFLSDLGFDYLWLSNGFGYSLDSWNVTGEVFDGVRFDTSNSLEINQSILKFWRDFRQGCPDFPIETRGSNLSTAMDLASDASPLRDIYQGGFNLIAPVNSPWAALNGDYGLEITGWLSHIASLPDGDVVPFRYYIHDPWWLNSPWLDRYGREPHDIYLPLSASRISAKGNIPPPDSVSFLTIDDSYGRMPEEVASEVTPHLRRALADFPDEPGLVTWIYPFEEYHEWTFANPNRVSEVFFGDWFMRSALNQGFPLNTVVSTENFLTSRAVRPKLYKKTILVCPAPDANTPLAQALLEHLEDGGRALLYGPLNHADPRISSLLHTQIVEPVSGELAFQSMLSPDLLRIGGFAQKLNFRSILSGGGLDTALTKESDSESLKVLAEAKSDNGARLFAAIKALPGNGQLGWIRGALCESVNRQSMLPIPDDENKWFRAERLMRWILGEFGYVLRFEKPDIHTADPIILTARCRGAWYFSGYSPNTNVRLHWRFPEGVPVPVGCDVSVNNGLGTMTLARAWHRECRVLVDQFDTGEVSCREQYSGEVGITRRLKVSGLINAALTFLPDLSLPGTVRIQKDEGYLGQGPDIPFETTPDGYLITRNISGDILISW